MKANDNHDFHDQSEEEEMSMGVIEEQLRGTTQRESFNQEVDPSYSLSDALSDMQELGRDLKLRGRRSFEDVQHSVKQVREYLRKNKG